MKSSKDLPRVNREGSICFFGQQPGDLEESDSGALEPDRSLDCVSIHSSFEIKDKRQQQAQGASAKAQRLSLGQLKKLKIENQDKVSNHLRQEVDNLMDDNDEMPMQDSDQD